MLLRLLLNGTEVTTEHNKWPKISTKSVKSYFFCKKGKKSLDQSPLQELEERPHNGLYLVVYTKRLV